MTSQYDKEVQFTCAVRGYHYYRREWEPEVEETLDCSHEKNNLFDHFAIKTISKKTGQIVGHLPIEVSRITKYLMDRGAEVTAKLTSDHYRRSPLIQGGLEIPCIVVAKMNGYSARNQMLLNKYEELVCSLYAEPKNEEILGSFLVPVASNPGDKTICPPTKSQKKKNNKAAPKSADIRSFFQATPLCNRKSSDNVNNVIVLDN